MNVRLYESVLFDGPVAVDDGQGGRESGWAEKHACRAHFLYLRGGEAVQEARLSGRQPVVVTIRRCAAALALTTDDRMRDARRSDVYNIRSIVETDNRLYLELTCERGGAV